MSDYRMIAEDISYPSCKLNAALVNLVLIKKKEKIIGVSCCWGEFVDFFNSN